MPERERRNKFGDLIKDEGSTKKSNDKVSTENKGDKVKDRPEH